MRAAQVTLTWQDNSVNEAGFEIQRDSGGGFATIATTARDATTYVDADGSLVAGTTYSYKVRAVNQTGQSAFIGPVSAPAKQTQTVTFPAIAQKAAGDPPFTITNVTATSGLTAFTFTSSDTSVATVSGNTITIVAGGSATITAIQAGNGTFAAASATQILVVGKSSQTITFNPLPGATLADPPFNLTATASSGLPVSYTSSVTTVATVSGNTVTIKGPGSTVITASQAGDTNSFNAAPNVTQTLTVAKADQTITFDPITTKTVGVDTSFAPGATSSSNLTVTYTSNNTAAATVSGGNITVLDGGVVTITANQAGNSTFNAAPPVSQVFTILKGPVFLTQPINKTIGSGSSTTFSVSMNTKSTPPFTYQWQISTNGGTSYSDLTIVSPYSVSNTSTSSGLTITAPATSFSGNLYRCVVTNAVSTAVSTGGLLTINFTPSFTTTGASQPTGQSTSAGGNATFTATAVGNPSPTYQWQISTSAGGSVFTNLANDSTYSGVTTNTLTITNVSSGLNNFRYQLIATNSAGTKTSAFAALTVGNSPPSITTDPSNQTVASGANAIFNVVAAGGPTPSIQWQVDTGGGFNNITNNSTYSGATTSTLTITGATTALSGNKYHAVATNGQGSPATSNFATLTVTAAAPVFTTQPIDVGGISAGANTSFTVAVTGDPAPTLQWQFSSDGGTTWGNLANDATYAGVTSTTLSITNVQTAVTGLYRAVATNTGGVVNSNAATLSLGAVQPTINTQPSNVTVAAGGNASFTIAASGTAPLTYRWQESVNNGITWTDLNNGAPYSGVTTTTLTLTGVSASFNSYQYRCVVTNPAAPAGIASNAALLAVTTTPPSFTTQPSNVTVTAPAATSFTAAATGNPTPTLHWQISTDSGSTWNDLSNSSPYSGVTTGTLSVSPSTGLNGNQYRCVASNVAGAANSNAVTLTVNAGTGGGGGGSTAPVVTVQPVGQTIATGGTISLSVTAVGTPTPTYQWRFNGANISGATSSAYTKSNAQPADGGNYDVVVSNSGGITTSVTVVVAVNFAPTITTQPTDKIVTVGGSASFTVVAAGSPAPTYQWRFNGSAISGGTSATYTIATTTSSNGGNYDVVITNSIGSVTSNAALLTVSPVSYAGEYFGTFSGGGTWAINIHADNTGTLIAHLPDRNTAIIQSFKVNSDGTFTINGAEIGTAEAGPTPASFGRGPTISAATSFTLTGKITGSSLSGQISGLNKTMTGSADSSSGPAQAMAGFYTAAAVGASAGTTYSIVGPSGQVFTVTTTSTSIDSSNGTLGSNGKATTTTTAGGQLALTVTNQALAATYIPTGSTTPIAFSGIPDTVPNTTRLVNISARSVSGAGGDVLIAGFVVSGGSKTVLIRGVGPTLSQYGVKGQLDDPTLALFSGQTAIVNNDDWGTATNADLIGSAFTAVGAFPLATSSRDAAMLSSVTSGNYSAQVAGKSLTSGIALAEIYDAAKSTTPRLINLSARGQVGTGDNVLIAGFVLEGNAPKQILVRAVGPTLTSFGVTGVIADPQLTLYVTGSSTPLQQNNDWAGTPALKAAFTATGAFSLPDTSKDAAILITLNPGNYSAVVSGVNNATGVGMVELYEVP